MQHNLPVGKIVDCSQMWSHLTDKPTFIAKYTEWCRFFDKKVSEKNCTFVGRRVVDQIFCYHPVCQSEMLTNRRTEAQPICRFFLLYCIVTFLSSLLPSFHFADCVPAAATRRETRRRAGRGGTLHRKTRRTRTTMMMRSKTLSEVSFVRVLIQKPDNPTGGFHEWRPPSRSSGDGVVEKWTEWEAIKGGCVKMRTGGVKYS